MTPPSSYVSGTSPIEHLQVHHRLRIEGVCVIEKLLLLSMRLKIAYSLPCLCNSEGPTLVNTTVFEPFVRFKNFQLAHSASRSQLEITVEYSSRADCRLCSMFTILIFCDAMRKNLGEGYNRRTLLQGFRPSEGFRK